MKSSPIFYIYIITCLLWGMLMVSCGSDKKKEAAFWQKRLIDMPEKVSSPQIESFSIDTIDVYRDVQEKYKISNILDSIRYLKLEKNKESVFSPILDVKVNKERLYVMDIHHRVKAFYKCDGKYVGNLFTVGEGPEDVIRPYDIEVDDSLLYVLDGRAVKIVMYNHKSDFVKKVDLPFRVHKMRKLSNDKFVLFLGAYNDHYKDLKDYKIIVADTAFTPMYKYKKLDTKEFRMDKTPFFSPTTIQCGFSMVYDNVFYVINPDDGTLKVRYVFDVGKKVDEDILNGEPEKFVAYILSHDVAVMYSTPIEGRNHIVFEIFTASKNKKGTFIYDKNTKKGVFVRSWITDKPDMLIMPRIVAYDAYTDEFVGVQSPLDISSFEDKDKVKIEEMLGDDLKNKLIGKDKDEAIFSFIKLKEIK